MKVFNITDASTAALRNQGLDSQHIRIGELVLAPGSSASIRGTAKERSELSSLIKAGAVALEQLPVWYAAKRGLNLDGTPFVDPEAETLSPEDLPELEPLSEPEPPSEEEKSE